MLAAWLANTHPQRQIVVVATTPGEAERWLTDLTLLTDGAVALYPQREALGEEEPHYEIAGERVETIEALLRGQVRIVITTARGTAERTLVPAALERLRLRLVPGDRRSPASAAETLETMGYRRVATVTEVAEFSVRGGILDVYGFGMAVPARLEWWGDDITSIRGFDLTTQRSLQELEEVSVLPVSTRSLTDGARPGEPASRKTLLELLPSDTFILQESAGADQDEVDRAWSEAEHHLDIARRLGEDVPKRDAILENPEAWRNRIAGFPRLTLRDDRPDLQFGFFPPEKVDRDLNRLRGLHQRVSPDAHPLRQRRAARAAGGAAGGWRTLRHPGDPRDRRARRWLRHAVAPGAHRPRDLPPGAPAAPGPALPAGGAFARHRRADGRRLRGPPRPRHRDLSRHPDDHGRRGDDRGGDRRVRGR